MFVAVDGALAGLLAVADPIKASTPEAIRLLHADGLRIVMLTGDNEITAARSPPTLGIDEVIAEVLPDQKRESSGVCSARAASSRWPATASTTRRRWPRRRSASRWAPAPTSRSRAPAITLVKGDLRGIVRARRLSRATMRNIRQNLFLAFVYNALGVPVAAGVLYPLHRAADQPDLGQRGDDVQLGVGDRQRAAAAARRAVTAAARIGFATLLPRQVAP